MDWVRSRDTWPQIQLCCWKEVSFQSRNGMRSSSIRERSKKEERHVEIQVELLFDPTVDHNLVYPRILPVLFTQLLCTIFANRATSTQSRIQDNSKLPCSKERIVYVFKNMCFGHSSFVTEKFNTCESRWLCLYTPGNAPFWGRYIRYRIPDDGTFDVPKHVGDLLEYNVYISWYI